jgi:hypothetical protein
LVLVRFTALADGTPGRRFRDRYAHAQRRRSRLGALLVVMGAIGLIIVGSVMLFTPGPGALLVLLGAALVAGESYRAARALDRIELALRAALRRLR